MRYVLFPAALLCVCLASPAAGQDMIPLPVELRDASGSSWDIQQNGSVSEGTGDAYDGGMLLTVNGMPFNFAHGLRSPDREIILGPVEVGGVSISRRIFVSDTLPLARWIEVFENRSGTPMVLSVSISSDLGSDGETLLAGASSEGGVADEQCYAFVTDDQAESGGDPALLHLFAFPDSPVRPVVTAGSGSGSIIYSYNLELDSVDTVALAHFEGQFPFRAEALRLMAELSLEELEESLPEDLRGRIVNLGGTRRSRLSLKGFLRGEAQDVVSLRDGGQLQGKLDNAAFQINTFCGERALDAGMIASLRTTGSGDAVQVALLNGEVYCGTLEPAELHFLLPSGQKLKIPLSRLQAAGYRRAKGSIEAPEEPGTFFLALRTGDRVLGRLEASRLRLETCYASLPIDTANVREINLDAKNSLHVVFLRDESVFSGILAERELRFLLSDRTLIEVHRDKVLGLTETSVAESQDGEEASSREGAVIELTNGDKFAGEVKNEVLVLQSDFGEVELSPDHLLELRTLEEGWLQVSVRLWDGGTITGTLGREFLSVVAFCGPSLRVPVSHIKRILFLEPELPEVIRREVERLVQQLGAEAMEDREAAQEQLEAFGPGIGAALRPALDSEDAEVRRRVQALLDRIGRGR